MTLGSRGEGGRRGGMRRVKREGGRGIEERKKGNRDERGKRRDEGIGTG